MDASFHLAGATWCPHTRHAASEIEKSPATVWASNLRDVLQVLECDKGDKLHPACVNVHGYPAVVACSQKQCEIILDGYMPDYSVKAANAIEQYLSHSSLSHSQAF